MPLKTNLLLLFVLFSLVGNTQNFSWKWASGLSSTEPDFVWHSKLDQQGNSYTVGIFGGDYQRKLNHRSIYNQTDKTIFLAKHDREGKMLWLEELNNFTEFMIQGLEVDFQGNVVVIGSYTKEFIYFMGERMENNVLNTNRTFVAQIATDGTLNWIKQHSDLTDELLSNLRLDGQGNIFMLYTGDSRFLTETDSSAWTLRNQFRNKKTSVNLLHLAPTGNLVWFTELEHNQINRTIFYDLEVDFEGNCYLTGYYEGDYANDLRYLDQTKIRNFMPMDEWKYFLMKVAPEGTIAWADQFPGVRIEVDETGNIYTFLKLRGNFNSDYLDIGDALIESREGENFAILKYDTDGTFQNHQTFGEIQEGEFVETKRNSTLRDDYSIHTETVRNNTTEEEADKVIKAIKYVDEYGNKDVITDSTYVFRNTSKERFEYGLDGKLYLLANCVGESVFGEYRTFLDGLYLTQLDTDLKFTNVGKQLNDDNKEELRNPFLAASTQKTPAPIIQHFNVGMDGQVQFYGHQYEQYLYLGGERLNNREFFKSNSSIWLGGLMLK